MFGPDLLVLRENSAESPALQDILRKFKVPVGLNDEEKAHLNEFFKTEAERKREASWFTFLQGPKEKSVLEAAEGLLNQHSKAIFLMAPDNKFLAFYKLDVQEKELAENIIEDISDDLGTCTIGTQSMPASDDTRFQSENEGGYRPTIGKKLK